MMRRRDQQSRVFYDLSSLIFNILRSPPSPTQFSDHIPTPPSALSSSPRPPVPSLPQITPAGFASLLFGLDGLWFCYILYWIHIDALGSGFGYGFILRWNCLQFVNAWTHNSFLCDVAAFTSEGGSCLETAMKVDLKWTMQLG